MGYSKCILNELIKEGEIFRMLVIVTQYMRLWGYYWTNPPCCFSDSPRWVLETCVLCHNHQREWLASSGEDGWFPENGQADSGQNWMWRRHIEFWPFLAWPFFRELAILAGTDQPFSTELAKIRGTEIDLYHTKNSEGFEILSWENDPVKNVKCQFSFKLHRELPVATMRFPM